MCGITPAAVCHVDPDHRTVSQLTSDLIQHSESQQTRAQTHCSAYTAAIFVKSAGQKDSKY